MKDLLQTRKHQFFTYIAFILLVFASCVPSRKAIYFNGLTQGTSTVDSLTREAAKKVYPGDRVLINIFTGDADANTILNSVAKTGQASQTFENGYLVDPDGFIEIPTLGNISVKGHTPTEIRNLVQQKVSELYKDVVVTCTISGRVIVLSNVSTSGGMNISAMGSAGVYSIPISNERLTIPEVLSGMRTTNLKLDKAWVIREIDGNRTTAKINLNSTEVFTSPYYYLRNNDVVYIEPNRLNQFIEANLPLRTLVSIATGFSGLLFTILLLTK